MVYANLRPRPQKTIKQLIGAATVQTFLNEFATSNDAESYSIEGVNITSIPKNFF